jgi:hypothetical protein
LHLITGDSGHEVAMRSPARAPDLFRPRVKRLRRRLARPS